MHSKGLDGQHFCAFRGLLASNFRLGELSLRGPPRAGNRAETELLKKLLDLVAARAKKRKRHDPILLQEDERRLVHVSRAFFLYEIVAHQLLRTDRKCIGITGRLESLAGRQLGDWTEIVSCRFQA